MKNIFQILFKIFSSTRSKNDLIIGFTTSKSWKPLSFIYLYALKDQDLISKWLYSSDNIMDSPHQNSWKLLSFIYLYALKDQKPISR